MRSATLSIHMGLPYNSIALSPSHQLQALFRILNHNFIQPFYVDTVLFVLMDQQLLSLCYFRVILKQISHLFIVELQEGAVDLDVLSAFCDQPLKEKVDASWDDACMILVLFHISEEGHLLHFVIVPRGLTPDDVVPIASEHGVCLSASRLPIGEQRDVEPFHSLEQQRFYDVKDLSLCGLGGQCQFYFLYAAKSSNFDLESGLIYEGLTWF